MPGILLYSPKLINYRSQLTGSLFDSAINTWKGLSAEIDGVAMLTVEYDSMSLVKLVCLSRSLKICYTSNAKPNFPVRVD